MFSLYLGFFSLSSCLLLMSDKAKWEATDDWCRARGGAGGTRPIACRCAKRREQTALDAGKNKSKTTLLIHTAGQRTQLRHKSRIRGTRKTEEKDQQGMRRDGSLIQFQKQSSGDRMSFWREPQRLTCVTWLTLRNGMDLGDFALCLSISRLGPCMWWEKLKLSENS